MATSPVDSNHPTCSKYSQATDCIQLYNIMTNNIALEASNHHLSHPIISMVETPPSSSPPTPLPSFQNSTGISPAQFYYAQE